ncbi:MAG TPA: hypothetical protein VF282_03670 [Bacillota bacterium]
MRSSSSDPADPADVLALPLEEAIGRLGQQGLAVAVIETSPPRGPLAGTPRVLAQRSSGDRVTLIVGRVPDPTVADGSD